MTVIDAQPHGRRPRDAGKAQAPTRPRAWPSPREAMRRVPKAAWLCAAIACVNSIAWSIVTPPFQVPDEPSHVAYVKQLVDEGRLPTHAGGLSYEEQVALEDLQLQVVAERPQYQTISSRAQERKLEHDLHLVAHVPSAGRENAGVATSQPPLYYLLEAIPYSIGLSGTLLDRIELMRLLSAVMGGLTALFTCLFLRELLARERWAWTAGGLCVALVPLLGFMSGAVNPDAMLFAVTAALFYCLARAFRRGLTRPAAISLGVLTAIGFATKLNFVGVAPGVLLGLIVLSVRAARTLGRTAYFSLALALAIAISPAAAYVIAHVASGAPALGIVSSALSDSGAHGSPWGEASYIWQLYLPRLPGMPRDFAGLQTARQLWFNGYVGLLGWLDTTFPGWVYDFALVPALLIAGLCARALIAGAAALRARTGELIVYCVIAVGLLVLIGADSFITFPATDAEYAETRYLLPLLPLLGAVLALAIRGAPRRLGPAAGAAIVALFLIHDIFSQLQVIARFYG
jgi:4-amino-4-deoxy-L-arabinose transferase-like glycosyltransferase